MVVKANTESARVSTYCPPGRFAKARRVIASSPAPAKAAGSRIMLLTTTRPVMAHTTTVSQKVPVIDTRACRTGFLVWAVAAAMGAVPRPDSLEKSPRAMP